MNATQQPSKKQLAGVISKCHLDRGTEYDIYFDPRFNQFEECHNTEHTGDMILIISCYGFDDWFHGSEQNLETATEFVETLWRDVEQTIEENVYNIGR